MVYLNLQSLFEFMRRWELAGGIYRLRLKIVYKG